MFRPHGLTRRLSKQFFNDDDDDHNDSHEAHDDVLLTNQLFFPLTSHEVLSHVYLIPEDFSLLNLEALHKGY